MDKQARSVLQSNDFLNYVLEGSDNIGGSAKIYTLIFFSVFKFDLFLD